MINQNFLFRVEEILKRSKNIKKDEESIVKYLKETGDSSLFLIENEVEESEKLSLFKIALKYDLEEVLCEAVDVCPKLFMNSEKMSIVLKKPYFKLFKKFSERPEYLEVESEILGWNYLFYLAEGITPENENEVKYIIKKVFEKHPEQKNKKDKSGDTIFDVMEYAGISGNLEGSIKTKTEMEKILQRRKAIIRLKKLSDKRKKEQLKRKYVEGSKKTRI
ncbi:MAG: hypothetical protein J6K39_04170 [Clostridia bacterium]|nr:hypothetical protein [Clostridia bacterium]